jgi:hypothetical protein
METLQDEGRKGHHMVPQRDDYDAVAYCCYYSKKVGKGLIGYLHVRPIALGWLLRPPPPVRDWFQLRVAGWGKYRGGSCTEGGSTVGQAEVKKGRNTRCLRSLGA